MMMRLWILAGIALSILPWTGGELSAAEDTAAPQADPIRRPNVLYVVCDDLRPQALSCYGSPSVRTPHIDQLAAGGVRFENAFCTTSLCSPSRASILTGLYAHRHGVRNNFTELPSAIPHFPARLRESGYRAAYIGKWHMGEDNDEPRAGFDWFVTHKGQGKYFDTEWNINGKKREVRPGYYTHVVTDLALEWLQEQSAERPWVLCLGHKAPHSFYLPEEKYAKSFASVEIPYPESAFQLTSKPKWIADRRYTWHGIYGPLFEWRKTFPDDRPEAVSDFSNMVRAYWGTVLSVDDSIGRLVDHLKAAGQLENTIIVFMGDNGLLEGEHGMVDKRTMHEPSIRIPLIVTGADLPRGVVVKEQVLTIDTAPSILDLCAAPPLVQIQGRSWKQLVTQGEPAWRTAWFYEYNYEKQFPYTPNIRGIRTDRWKFIRYPHGDGSPDRHHPELYDLVNDPLEIHNLAGIPEYQPLRSHLECRLQELLNAEGLSPAQDLMPLDEGIKTELPDQKIR